MHYSAQTLTGLTNNSRLLASAGAAAVITFMVFVLMDKLTHFESRTVEGPEAIPVFTFTFEEPEETTLRKQTLPPLEPPNPRPAPNSPDMVSTDDHLQGLFVDTIDLPETDLGRGDMGMLSMADAGARPMVRMQPKYPAKAAQQGIEGWVKLIFTIDASGAVRDIQVVDAEPKRIFNQAARRALSKWKYKPQFIAGKPVSQEGMEVVLDFKLNQG